MKRDSKKSQVTIFLIIGIVLVIIFVSSILLTRYAAKKTSKQETLNVKESNFDIQPIRNFITECLLKVSEEGLRKIGEQGGYLYKSQGGTLVDYSESAEGFFYAPYNGAKVSYNILNSRFPINNLFPKPPNYPWKMFPYKDSSRSEEKFAEKSAFGTNNLPPLRNTQGAHSLQEQLTTYVENNIDSCLDFSIFEEQGFEAEKKEKKVLTEINENNILFNLNYEIEIENLLSGEVTTIKQSIAKHNIRLGTLHSFLNKLIESDINDINFDITNNLDTESMEIEIKRDVHDKDDVVIVTDRKSMMGSIPYKYQFTRKNRNPALFYLFPEEVSVKPIDDEGNFKTISISDIISNNTLEALDPDEDVITNASFFIDPKPPVTLIFPTIDFKVVVSDGALEDYQVIKIVRGELN